MYTAAEPHPVIADLTREPASAAAQYGPVLVLAGAGTGKTKTLTAAVVHRIATGRFRTWPRSRRHLHQQGRDRNEQPDPGGARRWPGASLGFHTARELLDHAALSTGGPDEEETGRVQLMTLHKAKGLEFPHVFLPAWKRGCSRRTTATRPRSGGSPMSPSPAACAASPSRIAITTAGPPLRRRSSTTFPISAGYPAGCTSWAERKSQCAHRSADSMPPNCCSGSDRTPALPAQKGHSREGGRERCHAPPAAARVRRACAPARGALAPAAAARRW